MRNKDGAATGTGADAERDHDLNRRTKRFGLRVMRLVEALPRKMTADVIGRQLFRSATSVRSNYRSACRAKSQADFISKMGTVEEEADESGFWLEFILEAGLMSAKRVDALTKEADELVAIAVSSINTARKGRR